jgi:hypothetical protein
MTYITPIEVLINGIKSTLGTDNVGIVAKEEEG